MASTLPSKMKLGQYEGLLRIYDAKLDGYDEITTKDDVNLDSEDYLDFDEEIENMKLVRRHCQ